MKNTALLMLSLLSLPLLASGADYEAPEAFESISMSSGEALDFARRCVPSVSEASFSRFPKAPADTGLTISRPVDRTQPYLAVSGGTAYCVRRSARRYPVIPLAAFDGTVAFPGMPRDEERRLRGELSRQLAQNGFATATVVAPNGNAYQLVFLLTSATPGKMYYHANFIKKGEYQEGSAETTFHTPGPVSVTGMGREGEQVKYFFQRGVNPLPKDREQAV